MSSERGVTPGVRPGDDNAPTGDGPDAQAAIHMGWGRLLFAQTFADAGELVAELGREEADERDIAIYVDNPQVAVAQAPQDVFLDPSLTYRLWLGDAPGAEAPQPAGFQLRRLRNREDAEAINRLYKTLGMVPVPQDFFLQNRDSRRLIHYVAEEAATGEVVGTVTGLDHVTAINDPDNGCSMWCLAVDPQSALPGIGEALVRAITHHFHRAGRSFMDLTVLHDNAPAIKLYERLGFTEVQTFSLKRKNPVNETLYAAPQPSARLNPYARIIVNEARRRGIAVTVEDEEAALFHLTFGGRTVACQESLSELTTAVAMARCSDKAVTRRLMRQAGVAVPEQREAGAREDNLAFLQRHGSLAVKPARGEQGRAVAVDVTDEAALEAAIAEAAQHDPKVLLEACHSGQDLRVIVIDYAVVAAAVRQPAAIVGNGRDTIRALIQVQSRRRKAATGGESRIPMDEETQRCVAAAGYGLDEVLPAETQLAVRKTANLHTGGTIHDVTQRLSPAIASAAVRAAQALHMPVVGLDFLVPDPGDESYVMIEANERPGLANHEPQPTAERFIDLLFPQTRREMP